jgi:hypothetical protein
MFETYTYEFVRALNEERRTRALARYERMSRKVQYAAAQPAERDAEVVELVFATGCGSVEDRSA